MVDEVENIFYKPVDEYVATARDEIDEDFD
jgi:hypothetical protein